MLGKNLSYKEVAIVVALMGGPVSNTDVTWAVHDTRTNIAMITGSQRNGKIFTPHARAAMRWAAYARNR